MRTSSVITRSRPRTLVLYTPLVPSYACPRSFYMISIYDPLNSANIYIYIYLFVFYTCISQQINQYTVYSEQVDYPSSQSTYLHCSFFCGQVFTSPTRTDLPVPISKCNVDHPGNLWLFQCTVQTNWAWYNPISTSPDK